MVGEGFGFWFGFLARLLSLGNRCWEIGESDS